MFGETRRAPQPSRRAPEPPRPQPTGRFLVLFQPDAGIKGISSVVKRSTGAQVRDSRDFKGSAEAFDTSLRDGDAVVIERFGVAAIGPGDGGRVAALQASEKVRQTRPEFFMFAINELRQRYAAWITDGLQLLAEGVTAAFKSTGAAVGEIGLAPVAFADTEEFTWGLQALGAHRSAFMGRGISVAVLDTGIDLEHPDFVGRQIVHQSFVANEGTPDVQGHGTHCAGTVAGRLESNIGRRYGVAPEANLHVGKVLDNGGSGREMDILAGINWAIDQRCAIISMSLGRPTFPGEQPDPLYEEVGATALREGSLIIAAAGNESARDFGFIAPVGAPANSPSIMAVAAVDPTLTVASFSCGGITPGGGEVNISGPGVSVYSSYPHPRLSRLLQGTSMACPHVAGVAALWAESDPTVRGENLREALERSAREIGSRRDYGRGLVQAPDAVAGA